MSFNFKQSAQEATSFCKLMAGKTQLKTEDVADKELTVIAFDFAPNIDKVTKQIQVDQETGEVITHGVIVFKENPGAYYSVGTIFTKICNIWASNFSSAKEASEALEKEGGVRVRFRSGVTKTGNPCVQVDILD